LFVLHSSLGNGDAALTPTLTYRDLFQVFLKAGLAFGGGPGIIATLEDELVGRRQVVTREEFLTKYALGRMIPAGTSAAMAVGFGYRFGGLLGTAVALGSLLMPGVVLTILLTAAFTTLQDNPFLGLLSATLLPAATAFILLAAVKLGEDVFRPSLDLVLAAAAFAGVLVFGLHPVLILLGGGLLGAIAFRGEEKPA
jgi:chromate transporter